MIIDVVLAPQDVLSKKAAKIEKIDGDVLRLIEDMKETLVAQTDPEGIGLAAPQVGRSVSLFIVKPEKNSPFDIYINPVIELLPEKEAKKGKPNSNLKQHSGKEGSGSKLEGCLSLKVIWGTVKRAKKVKAEWTDEHGKKHAKVFSGFYATILQHEYDHLQGILFPRRVLEQHGQLYKSHKDDEGKDVFEAVEI